MESARRSDPSSIAVPWSSPSLQVVLGTTLVSMMGITLISPALPTIREAFAITDAQASLVITAFTIPSVFLAPGLGMLADRHGRRRVLVPCLFVFGVSGGAIVAAPSFVWLLGLRFVQGIAASGIYALALTLIGDMFTGVQRNAVMGANGAALSLGTTIYPILGGALAAIAWFAPFSVFPLGVLVGLFALYALDEPTVERTTLGTAYVRSALRSVSLRAGVVVYGLLFVTIALLYGAAHTALPFLLARSFGMSTLFIGLTLGVKSFTAALVSTQNGRLARHLSNIGISAVGFLGFGAGLVTVWVAGSPAAVGVAMVIFGVGQGLLLPSLDTAVSNLAPARFRAGMMSLRMSVQKLGQTVGPTAFALAAVTTGYATLMLIAGLGSAVLALFVAYHTAGRPTRRAVTQS